MFCVNKSRYAAVFLTFCYNMQRNCGFTGRFRTINFNNSSLWHAANTQRTVQRNGTSRNGFHLDFFLIAQTHQTAFSKLTVNLF